MSSNLTPTATFYVYVLENKAKKLYIRFSSDLRKRLQKHNEGKSLATKSHRPYKLIHYEALLSQKDAKNREEYLKTGWGWRSLKKIQKNYFYERG